MTQVDKITGAILVVAIVVVGVLAGLADINGEAALGFISGIAVALVTHSTARIAVNQAATTTKSSNDTNTPTGS